MRGRPKALPNLRLASAVAAALLGAMPVLPVGPAAGGMGNAQVFRRRAKPKPSGWTPSGSNNARTQRTKHHRKRKPRAWRKARVLKLRAKRR